MTAYDNNEWTNNGIGRRQTEYDGKWIKHRADEGVSIE
jgi:hypothetical protein